MTALFVNLLLVQLLLVGTGAACADRASTMGADGADHGAMSAERMAAGHDASADGGTRSFDCAAGGSDHAPCGMPSSAPGGGGACQQMSSCATAMIVQSPAPLVASLDPTRAVVASALVPPGTTPAPDVPPPRA